MFLVLSIFVVVDDVVVVDVAVLLAVATVDVVGCTFKAFFFWLCKHAFFVAALRYFHLK